MEKIEMYKCPDGQVFDDVKKAERHEKRIAVEAEVTKYLATADESGFTQSVQKDILIKHWEQVKKYFSSGSSDDTMLKNVFTLAIDGLMTEDENHKQWYIEEILRLTVDDFDETHDRYQWEHGLEP